MRGEILGFGRRRRWSDEAKLAIVLSVGVGGATVTQIAQRHEVTRQQADGYKGYAKLYTADLDGNCQFREAACWAHLRRDFHDVWAATKSEIAREALDRIGALYDVYRQ